MKCKSLFFLILFLYIGAVSVFAQIGYQVSLLNSATGEPRANERVSVTVEITNKAGEAIFSSTQNATSNDFGIISLTIGNADTFKDVDWAKLPFFIAVTIEGKLIAKSQILNVPVAEVAKTLVPAVSLDELCGKKWYYSEYFYDRYIVFNTDGTFTRYNPGESYYDIYTGKYYIEGHRIYCYDYYLESRRSDGSSYTESSKKVLNAFLWMDGELHQD